jgi:xylulokinase
VPHYLGLDSSTQSLTAMVIAVEEDDRRVVFEHSLSFDEEFPEYGTTNGVHRGRDPREVSSSPVMWADALDRMMAIVSREGGFELSSLAAISGSAQQHGSVYLNQRAAGVLAALDRRQPLARQLAGVFSRDTSPIWMDESTTAQCAAIERAVGGREALARLTGSAAAERFTGPQIRKFFEQQPDAYAATGRIHLVSSYLASLLAGRDAPLDPGDGAGTNLMDIGTRRWAEAALAATAPGLADRLPDLQPSWTAVGPLAPFWQQRYGFPPSLVIAWSGDNPSSVVGSGLVREGAVAISLGTSDTLFTLTKAPRVQPDGSHVFGSPTGDYMSLICFKNGSLARERIRDTYGLDWHGFSRALRNTPAGNRGALMLPWFDPEITPHVEHPGVRRRNLAEDDAEANVRAVVEAQMMAMANHAAPVIGSRVSRVLATGGASANRDILQIAADVFDADVYQLAGGNSACLGAALRAFHAHERAQGRDRPWEQIVAGFAEPLADSRVTPIAENVAVYAELKKQYAEFEFEGQTGVRQGSGRSRGA